MSKIPRFSKSDFYRKRKLCKLTFKKLGIATGINPGELSQFEHGRIRRNWKTDKAIRYMEGLVDESKI